MSLQHKTKPSIKPTRPEKKTQQQKNNKSHLQKRSHKDHKAVTAHPAQIRLIQEPRGKKLFEEVHESTKTAANVRVAHKLNHNLGGFGPVAEVEGHVDGEWGQGVCVFDDGDLR
jgi:hypothetical protein